jgi:hypothetical protein
MKNFFVIWWREHKTKTLGFLQMLTGAILLYQDQLDDFLSKRAYGIVIFGCGILTAIIGYINGRKDDPKP